MNAARRGEVWLIDLGLPKEDHEQAGRRPAVVFQTDYLSPLNTVVIIPLTTQLRRAGFPNTVLVTAREGGQDRDSVALCHQIRALDRRKLIRKIGELTPERLTEIELAVNFCVGAVFLINARRMDPEKRQNWEARAMIGGTGM